MMGFDVTMKFGINTWFLQELNVKEALERISLVGFKAAEVWMEHLLKTGESPESVKEMARELNLELSLHATSYDINLTSINRGIREESIRQAREAIITGKQIGAKIVVLHPGRLSASRANREECWNQLLEVLRIIDNLASECSVVVGIEAMEKRAREIFVTPDDVHRMFNVKWKKIGLTLDIAHAFTLMDPLVYLEQIEKDNICHIHISDAAPGQTHIPLGEGQIDIDSVLKALEHFYSGLIIVEGYVPGEGEKTIKKNFEYLHSLYWV